MELLAPVVVIGLIIAFVAWLVDENAKEKARAEEKARQKAARRARLSDPRWVSAELVRLVGAGDPRAIQDLVHGLPAWPLRPALLGAAQRLAVLSRGVGTAEPAGVPRAMLDDLWASIEGAKYALSSVAIKIVSLVNQSGDRWKLLPDEARRWLEADARTLRTIEAAAVSLHRSLAVAIAAGERTGGQYGQQSGHTLHALAEAIRELSQPTR